MTLKALLITTTAIISLAACDGGKKDETSSAPAKEAATTETSSATETIVEKAKEMVTLDTSSVEAFKSSLSSMKDSLSDADKAKLTSALGNLAKKAAAEKSEGGGLLGAAKDIASGGSVEDQIYKSFKDKISGMNFDDLLSYAG